jgi:hypothetical protein
LFWVAECIYRAIDEIGFSPTTTTVSLQTGKYFDGFLSGGNWGTVTSVLRGTAELPPNLKKKARNISKNQKMLNSELSLSISDLHNALSLGMAGEASFSAYPEPAVTHLSP